jgi:serine-type D-Ala-D-Ala carboxypeptidase/endopeptidase (penicillin-binding protein 4)
MRARLGLLRPLSPLLILVVTLASSAPGRPALGANEALDRRLTGILTGAGLEGAVVAGEVRRVSGEVLFSRNTDRPMLPASNLKLVLTATALQMLGPDYRFTTTVRSSAAPEGGAIAGGLVIVGESDPASGPALYRRLAADVRAGGVRRIEGPIRAPRAVLAAEDSARASAQALHTALGKAGVTVTGAPEVGPEPDEGLELARIQSEPLSSLIRRMNKPSDNRLAELLRAALVRRTGPNTSASFMRRLWQEQGLDVTGVTVADGCGLSRENRLTAQFVAALLAYCAERPETYAALGASFPVAGRDGTLEDRMCGTAAEGCVVAKTGTLTGVSALSGYVQTGDAETMIFCFISNNHSCTTAAARAQLDRAVVAVAEWARRR